ILVVGTAIIVFGLVIPTRLGLGMELSVGLMLIVLGVMNVVSFVRSVPVFGAVGAGTSTPPRSHIVHSHAHIHGDYVHTHPHGHDPEAHRHAEDRTPLSRIDRALQRFKFYRPIRPLVIGIVHGLAGSAAAALLVLATIRDPRWAVAYLLVFGVGTIAGMMLITMSTALALHVVSGPKVFQKFSLVSRLLP